MSSEYTCSKVVILKVSLRIFKTANKIRRYTDNCLTILASAQRCGSPTLVISESDIALPGATYSPGQGIIHHHSNGPAPASSSTSAERETVSSHSVQFDPLSYPVLSELCAIWFKRYHPWFPILHQPSLIASLQQLKSSKDLDQSLAVKAICVVTLPHYESPLVSLDERNQWSASLRDSICCQALKQVSLQSLQALLILSNLDYGEGRFEQFWNLIAWCKR